MLPVRCTIRGPLASFTRDSLFEPLRLAESLLQPSIRGAQLGIDVLEEENRYVILADLPGYGTQDLDITVEDGVLTIAAEKSQETERKGENYHVRERSFGRVARSLRLPDEVNPDSVKASLKDGVLSLTIEKSEATKPHKVEVKAG